MSRRVARHEVVSQSISLGPALLLCQCWLVFECGVDGAGELAFEAADRLAAGLALALFALQLGTRRRVDAALRDRDSVQGAVELAVAAAVEPVALLLAGAGFEWGDAGVTGQLGVACEAVDRADLAEQLGRAERAAAGEREQPRRGRLGARLQLALEFGDRTGQLSAAPKEVASDPHLGRLFAMGEPPSEPLEPDAAVERPERHQERRISHVTETKMARGARSAETPVSHARSSSTPGAVELTALKPRRRRRLFPGGVGLTAAAAWVKGCANRVVDERSRIRGVGSPGGRSGDESRTLPGSGAG